MTFVAGLAGRLVDAFADALCDFWLRFAAVLFAQVLLRDRPGEKGVDMAAKTRWVEYLLEG